MADRSSARGRIQQQPASGDGADAKLALSSGVAADLALRPGVALGSERHVRRTFKTRSMKLLLCFDFAVNRQVLTVFHLGLGFFPSSDYGLLPTCPQRTPSRFMRHP